MYLGCRVHGLIPSCPYTAKVSPTSKSGHAVEIGAIPVQVLGAEVEVTPCKPTLQASKEIIMINMEMVHEQEFNEPIQIEIQDSMPCTNGNPDSAISGMDEKGASEPNGAVTTSNQRDKAMQDIQMQSGGNPALKVLKSKNHAFGQKLISATKFTRKILPMSTALGEESTEEEGGEEEDSKEQDDEFVDGEDEVETSEGTAQPQKQRKRAPPKRKALKSKNGKKNHTKKMKVLVSERVSTAKNTRTTKKKSSQMQFWSLASRRGSKGDVVPGVLMPVDLRPYFISCFKLQIPSLQVQDILLEIGSGYHYVNPMESSRCIYMDPAAFWNQFCMLEVQGTELGNIFANTLRFHVNLYFCCIFLMYF